HIQSNADGRLLLRERLTALDDVTTTEVATGLIGVLNNPVWVYQRGSRRIAFGEQVEVVPPLSGRTLENNEAGRIVVDGALAIVSPAPLRARYEAASEPDHGRATDKLYLNYLGGERRWTKG